MKFNEDLIDNWLKCVDTSKFVSSFLLFMRFAKSFEQDDLTKIESIVIDELGDIDQFRETFNLNGK